MTNEPQITQKTTDNAEKTKEKQSPKKGISRLLLKTERTAGLIAGDFKSLLGFEIAYRVICLVVFFPILVYLERLMLYVNGTDNLAQYNVGKSFLNPLTWLILLVILMFVVLFTLIEQGSLARAIHASTSGVRLNVKEILAEGTRYAIDNVNAANWPLLPYILLVLPLTALADETSIVRFIEMPGFILEFIYQRQWAAILWYAANVIILLLSIGWIFTFTVMAIEQKGFSHAAKRSWKAVRTIGVFRLIAVLLCYYILCADRQCIGSYCICTVVSALALDRAGKRELVCAYDTGPDRNRYHGFENNRNVDRSRGIPGGDSGTVLPGV